MTSDNHEIQQNPLREAAGEGADPTQSEPGKLVVPGPTLGSQCPEGYLTVHDLVSLLRATEDGEVLPDDVLAHFQKCDVCNKTWEFLKEHDPQFKEFRRERLSLVIATVLAEDEEDFADGAPANEELSPEQRETLTREMTEEFLAVQEQKGVEWIHENLELAGKLSLERIYKHWDDVKAIANDRVRYHAATDLARCFKKWVDLNRNEHMKILASLLRPAYLDTAPIDLSTLSVPLEESVAFILNYPATSFFTDVPILERSGEKVLFHRSTLAELDRKFQDLRPRYVTDDNLPGNSHHKKFGPTEFGHGERQD